MKGPALLFSLGASLSFSAVMLAACSGASSAVGADAAADGAAEAGDGSTDPCLGVALPACPRRCDAFPMTGACSPGDRCAVSEIGDACECQSGGWACSPHPPLGMGCNKVCRDLPPPSDAGADGADGAADGGQPCDPNAKDPCGPNGYCKSSDCVTGVCAPRPPETSNTENPVCGCDGITYWNENVAAARGMSVKEAGACKIGVKCGGPGPTKPCPTNFSCSMELASAGGCAIQSAPGLCWALPKTCPALGIGPITRACGAAQCAGRCTLIGNEEPYYRDNTCPQ